MESRCHCGALNIRTQMFILIVYVECSVFFVFFFFFFSFPFVLKFEVSRARVRKDTVTLDVGKDRTSNASL